MDRFADPVGTGAGHGIAPAVAERFAAEGARVAQAYGLEMKLCGAIHAEQAANWALVKTVCHKASGMGEWISAHNFKHPASRFLITIVHPQKDVPVV